MEIMILQTICGAVMVLIGAVIARGFPAGGEVRGHPAMRAADEQEDAYARDLAAMMEYGSEQEDEDEA